MVVVILASYLNKTARRNLKKYLYSGAVAAVLASLLVSMVILALYGELQGSSAEVFEGIAALTATAVLTYTVLWMTRHARTIKAELESRVEATASAGQAMGMAALSFIVVFREGLETVLLLTALLLVDPSGTIFGALGAGLMVAVVAILLMRGIYRLDVRRFFQVTSVLLVVFAAGLAGYGVHELIEAGEDGGVEWGILGKKAFDVNPPLNLDGTYSLLHEKGAIGSVFAALVGYAGSPEWLRVIAYLGYWLVIGTYILSVNMRSKIPA